MDHILPRSQGGKDEYINLQLLVVSKAFLRSPVSSRVSLR
ncbi:HNH endonuclease [Neosynechococcus sphagnicola]